MPEPKIYNTRCSVVRVKQSVNQKFSTGPWQQRTLKRKDERHEVGDFYIVRAPPEGVAHSQRLRSGGNGVVKALQPRLKPSEIAQLVQLHTPAVSSRWETVLLKHSTSPGREAADSAKEPSPIQIDAGAR
jgi:hypothetical protein